MPLGYLKAAWLTHKYRRAQLKFLLSLFCPTLLILGLSLNAKAQCAEDDIVISTSITWTNQTVNMTEDQKIVVTDGATLTMDNCTIQRKSSCTGYWDGIYLITDGNGHKAGLVLTNGTRIEFSKKGIQAVNGFSQILLDESEMSDNGQMIHALDNWPLAPIISLCCLGGFASPDHHSRDGGIISPYDIGCDGEFPAPPKVTIRNHCTLKVFENGNLSTDPPKYESQIKVLGGALEIKASEIDNGTDYPIIAVASSRGKCRVIDRTGINGFWIGVYKGSDASANCVSEGLELTYSLITDINLFKVFGEMSYYEKPGFSVYNISSNVMMYRNILESNIWSFGVSYGSMIENNIYNGHDEDVPSTSVYIHNPKESFVISGNGITETPLEFIGNNQRTYVTCNTIIDEVNAVVAGGDNTFPMSWGTASKAAGNLWDGTQSTMYNLSGVDLDMRYYYRDFVSHEIFTWADGFTEMETTSESSCSYFWPANALSLDPDEYEVSMEDLEDEYDDTEYLIESIIGHEDTTILSVKEELEALRNKLNELVGQGLLFHTTSDKEFWTDKIDPKVEELLGLNYLWYGHYMGSIEDFLNSNTDPDAEALYDATIKMMDFFDNGKNIYTLTNLQVDTLQKIAESSYGDYTNILRNYLFMVYDRFIPFERKDSGLDGLRRPVQRPPVDQPVYTSPDHTVRPNPFTDDISIEKSNFKNTGNTSVVSVYNTEGKLVSSSIYKGNSTQLNLADLAPGIYILKIRDSESGKIEVKQILKGWK